MGNVSINRNTSPLVHGSERNLGLLSLQPYAEVAMIALHIYTIADHIRFDNVQTLQSQQRTIYYVEYCLVQGSFDHSLPIRKTSE